MNDAFGEIVGDQVLDEVGRRILRFVPSRSLVGRLDGDEFGISVAVGSEDEGIELADARVIVIAAPILVGNHSITVSTRALVGIDGFGVGQSCLGYLGSLSIDFIKRQDVI